MRKHRGDTRLGLLQCRRMYMEIFHRYGGGDLAPSRRRMVIIYSFMK
jgi:hypothetical protein